MQYKFVRDQPDKLFYKYFYSSPGYKYTTIYNKRLTTRSSKAPTRQRLYEKAIGIQPSKKEALLKLCRQDLIPQEHWNFFQSLIVNGKNNDDSDTDNEEWSKTNELHYTPKRSILYLFDTLVLFWKGKYEINLSSIVLVSISYLFISSRGF